MNISEVKSSLQDLIIRLQDSEKGYNEIEKATSNVALKSWMDRKAKERHTFHKVIESQMVLLGGEPEVKTSFLGDLHRMFIDIKINNVSAPNEFEAIVEEIKRGAGVLINDYQRVIEKVELSDTISKTLLSQKLTIEQELSEIEALQKEINAVEA